MVELTKTACIVTTKLNAITHLSSRICVWFLRVLLGGEYLASIYTDCQRVCNAASKKIEASQAQPVIYQLLTRGVL